VSVAFSLRDARLNSGLTQRALARRAGVTLSTVQRLEARQGARPANAKKVADYFGVQVTDLLPPLDDDGKAAA
jgi:transcriptional regulator with XRE-family HTH domain